MRIATYNIWARHGAWAERRPVLIDTLRRLRPDLIALQEVVVQDTYDQAADLLGPDYHLLHLSGRSDDGVGAAIASRWPLGAVHELDLHLTPRVDPAEGWIGRTLALEISVPEPIGALLLVHYTNAWQWGFEREREVQARTVAQFVEELVRQRSMHVVLASDLNASPEAASVRFWRGRQALDGLSVCYADAWERMHPDEVGHTFTPRNPLVAGGEMPLEQGRRIDYVLVRCGDHGPSLEIAACERVLSEPVDGVWASDHFGVTADLVVPAGATPT